MGVFPIETLHNRYFKKINILSDILMVYDLNGFYETKNPLIKKNPYEYFNPEIAEIVIQNELLRLDYLHIYSSTIDKYINTKIRQRKKEESKYFISQLLKKQILSRINNSISVIKQIKNGGAGNGNGLDAQKLYTVKNYIREFGKDVETIVSRVDPLVCPKCKNQLDIISELNQARCIDCSYVTTLNGLRLVQYQDNMGGDGIKHGNYEIQRHFKLHWNQMMANKPKPIKDSTDKKIRRWFKLNNIKYISVMGYEDWRRCLKDIKETSLNCSIPYLRVKYGGMTPPNVSYQETNLVSMYFSQAAEAYEQIKEPNETNIKFYPYFMFKIIEIVFSHPSDIERKRMLIDNIHFQEAITIERNDNKWKQICDIIPSFRGKFKRTNRNLVYFK
jgi:uncharacterized protein YbaR (Trm112 family)